MNKEQIAHIFGMLSRLESMLDESKKLINQLKDKEEALREHSEFQKVIHRLRLVANKLQLDFAKSDEEACLRSLKIAYGLNEMVSGNLLASYINISNLQASQSGNVIQSKQFKPVEFTCH